MENQNSPSNTGFDLNAASPGNEPASNPHVINEAPLNTPAQNIAPISGGTMQSADSVKNIDAEPSDNQKKSPKKYMIYGIIGILILAMGYFAYSYFFKDNTNNEEPATTNTLSESTNTLSDTTAASSEKVDELVDELKDVYPAKPETEKNPKEQPPGINFGGLLDDDSQAKTAETQSNESKVANTNTEESIADKNTSASEAAQNLFESYDPNNTNAAATSEEKPDVKPVEETNVEEAPSDSEKVSR